LPGSGAAGVAIWGGAPVVMPRGCRLRLNLVTKYRVSGVVCDSRIHYLGRASIASARYYFDKWCQSRRSEKTWENISGSHGDRGARERLRRVTWMVVTGELDLGLG
jgi:hypothetical protein